MSTLSVIEHLVNQGYSKRCNTTGLLHNLNYDLFYPRETAFAAYIFCRLHGETAVEDYRTRALECFNAVSEIANKDSSKLVEPVIYPRKTIFKSGSLPGTILVAFALSKTQPFLKKNIDFNLAPLILQAYNGAGGFSHDVKQHANLPVVLNTCSMALWYLSYRNEKEEIRKATSRKIVKSQLHNGAWPYVAPTKLGVLGYRVSSKSKIAKKISLKIFKDKSPFFIDYLHHVVTLYYFCQSIQNPVDLVSHSKTIDLAINFALKPLTERHKHEELRLDFEPTLSFIRHCNMKDSSALFYLLSCLAYLKKKSYSSQGQSIDSLFLMVKSYIDENLVGDDFIPYLSDDNQYIMNRPAESHYDKSFLYLDAISDVCD